MEVIFLGTGTSQGVPMIGCPCDVCRSDDPRDRRSRTSVHVVMNGLHVQVDAAQELRLQCVAQRVEQVDLFVLTHGHADHILGMDDLRRFCDRNGGAGLPVYSTPEGLERVRSVYPYAVRDRPLFNGYPAFNLRPMPERLEMKEGAICSTLLPHGPVEVLGLVFVEAGSGRKLVYYTDCKSVGPEAMELARGADVAVLDGLRPESHPTHMSLGEAVEVAAEMRAGRTFITHLTHAVDHRKVSGSLSAGVELAYDGLRIQV